MVVSVRLGENPATRKVGTVVLQLSARWRLKSRDEEQRGTREWNMRKGPLSTNAFFAKNHVITIVEISVKQEFSTILGLSSLYAALKPLQLVFQFACV